MNKNLILIFALFVYTIVQSQNTNPSLQQNANQTFMNNKDAKKVTIGGYGQIDYNETEGARKGKLDVHRLVLLFGYNFNNKVQFFTEIEYEHVKEVYVEQAFLNYSIKPNLTIKAGLMLVPMGIINEYHESPTFFGVERPSVDHDIVPTTWREIGIGISGKFSQDLPLKYQAYIFNGFGSNGLRGKDGLRKGRQKGAESTISSPTFSAKLDYYGIKGLRVGLSGYFGDTQTASENPVNGETIGVNMIGLDARYRYKKLKMSGQFITTSLKGVADYNTLNSSDLGSEMQGFYVEAGYNILDVKKEQKLFPFMRFEQYNTHAKTEGFSANKAFDRQILTFGFNYDLAPGAAFKMDYQIKDDKTSNFVPNQFNTGIAIWF